MFSNDFMRYLINYQPDGCEEKKVETIKEIEFKTPKKGTLAKVYITASNK